MRLITWALAATVCFSVTPHVLAQDAPTGEQLYLQHCVQCHEGLPGVPTREELAFMTAPAVENALSTFSMRNIGETLTHAERRTVSEYFVNAPVGSLPAPLDVIPSSAYCSNNPSIANPFAGPAWNGWSPGLANSRVQTAEAAGITNDNVGELELAWAFGIPGVASSGSQVSVVGDRVFVGSRNGMLWSLDKETGCIVFAYEADGGVRSTPVVAEDLGVVFFGDSFAQIYALDARTGEELWKVEVEEHPISLITGATTYYDGTLYVPVSSIEEGPAANPTYECCTFRGSMVALDPETGDQRWKTRTINRGPEPTGENSFGVTTWGPSGAAIWSAPTIDVERGAIYAATGDNYTHPATATSDAIMAFDMDSGRVLWTTQVTPDDVWNVACIREGEAQANCPEDEGPDYDFGSSTVLATRSDGSQILLAGQKSGVLYGLNPDDGEMLWETRVGDGGTLGGIEWGFAAAGDRAWVAISELSEKAPGEAGGLSAVDLHDGSVVWTTEPSAEPCENRVGCHTALPAAVSAVPGVVFAGSSDGHLRAFDADTGEVIWDYDTVREFDTVNGVPAHGGAMNGPGASVAGGMVFITPGYASFGMMPGNVLLAFEVDD